MASALRPVAHEDRLSLVEHLTELRVRIVICLVAFLAATAVCMWQNQTVLDILNRPLTKTQTSSKDPLVLGARFDQNLKAYLLDDASLNRQAAAVTTDRRLREQLLASAALA